MIPAPTALGNMSAIFWVSLVFAAAFALPIYRALLALKSRQVISEFVPEHAKKQGTPTMGGLIVVIGFTLACLYATFMDLAPGPVLPVAVALCVGFACIGFLDDFVVPRMDAGKRGLGWKQKLFLEIAIAGAAALWLRHGHLGTAVVLTTIVILFFANAYNFVDGMDGLAGSVLILFGGGLCALGLLQMRPDVYQLLSLALLGAVIPFLFLNAPPAKIFMGDVGALPIGAVLGLIVNDFLRPGRMKLPPHSVSSLGIFPPRPLMGVWQTALPLFVLSILLIIELVPVPLQVASVKLRKKRLFPMTPIHHAFEKAGWPESRVVWLFSLFQLLLVALALAIAIAQPVIVQ